MDFSDQEVDYLVKEDEQLYEPQKRGKAYKRVQRRNHMQKRAIFAVQSNWYSEISDIQKGKFSKTHLGCNKARCRICHYGKVYKLKTYAEKRFADKMADEIREMDNAI